MASIATLTSGESGANSLTDINNNFTAVNTIAGYVSAPNQKFLLVAGATRYYDTTTSINGQASPNDAGNMMTGSHTIKNFYLQNSPNGQNFLSTFTLLKNGVATSIQVSVAGAATASVFADTTNTVAVSGGDNIVIRGVAGSGSGNASFGFSYEIN